MTTDKTSTAPVMSREDAIVRNLCRLMNSLGLAWAKDPEARTDDSAEAAQNLINYVLGLNAPTPDAVGGFSEADVARCEVAMVQASAPDAGTDLEFNKACVRAVLEEFTRGQVSDVVGGDVVWHSPSEKPPVDPGRDRFFQIAVRRKYGEKVASFPAVYCNSYALMSSAEPADLIGNGFVQKVMNDDDDGIYVTGWYDVKSDDEYETRYQPALADGDELLGWCELPQWGAAPRVQGDVSNPAEQTRGDDPLSGKYGDVLRPFVAMMERELHANAGKGDRPGWLSMDRKTALLEIFYHLAKLQKAAKDDSPDGIREYAADVANMAMMLVDVCGALPEDVKSPRQAVPDELIADLRKFYEETEACDEFDLSNEATAALLAANLIEGTHFVLTAKGEAMLAAAPSAGRMGWSVGDIAALFVESDGAYFGVPGVDPWDEPRDARKYSGPSPVVAHPPCQRWGRYWHGAPNKPNQYRLGEDGGCFAAALTAVRNYGGVLEHPAHSRAWGYFGLATPPKQGGWVRADAFSGWTCHVEQGHYGHLSRKATWLYAVGTDLPELVWGGGASAQRIHPVALARYGYEKARRIGMMAMVGGKDKTKIRNATPEQFRDVLIAIASSRIVTRSAA